MLLASGGGLDSIVQFITVLVIFALVLGITLFVTRWIAGFQKTQMSGSNISVIETTKISPNQYIQIVKIAGHYIAIAVSKDQITQLIELDETEINTEKQNVAPMDFSTVFKQFRASGSTKEEALNNINEDEEQNNNCKNN